MRSGVDIFFVDPGKLEGQRIGCGVCSSDMNVEKNVVTARSWAGAISKQKKPSDIFTCPHRDEDWHKQAKSLIEEMKKTPSPGLAAILERDLEKVLSSRSETKKVILP